MSKILILENLSISIVANPDFVQFTNSAIIGKARIKKEYHSLIIIDDLFEVFNTYIDEYSKFCYNKFNKPRYNTNIDKNYSQEKEISFFNDDGKIRFMIANDGKTFNIDRNIINKIEKLGNILK